jgi:hypothetical protein
MVILHVFAALRLCRQPCLTQLGDKHASHFDVLPAGGPDAALGVRVTQSQDAFSETQDPREFHYDSLSRLYFIGELDLLQSYCRKARPSHPCSETGKRRAAETAGWHLRPVRFLGAMLAPPWGQACEPVRRLPDSPSPP